MNRVSRLRIATSVLIGLASSGAVHGQQALILSDSAFRTDVLDSANALAGILVGLGIPAVTIQDPPPADIGDLSAYRCVLDVRVDLALSGADSARMSAYLRGGGSLYLAGEHGLFFFTRDDSIDRFLNGEGGGPVASDPNSNTTPSAADILEPVNPAHPITGCVTEVDYDGIANGHYLSIGTGTWLTRSPATLMPSAVAWGAGQLAQAPDGRVVTALDINYTSDGASGGSGTLDWMRLNFPTIPTQNRAWVTNLLGWLCTRVDSDCIPSCEPRNHGYWHRYCLGTGTIDPGRNGQGNGPGPNHDTADFPANLLASVDAAMAPHGLPGCQALDEGPFSDERLAALRELATLHFNLGVGWLERTCPVELHPVDDSAGLTVGDALALMEARLALGTEEALREARWIGEHVANREAIVRE